MSKTLFPFRQPFRDNNGDVVIKSSETTVHGITTIQVAENKRDYKPDQLQPITPEEFQKYLHNDFE